MAHKILTITVEGNPIPKGRHRTTRSGHTYTPKKTVVWEQAVAWSARIAMVSQGVDFFELEIDLGLILVFSRADKRRADGDNLEKAVKDAMNGVVYQDDSQVLGCYRRVYRGTHLPGVTITIMPISEFDKLYGENYDD